MILVFATLKLVARAVGQAVRRPDQPAVKHEARRNLPMNLKRRFAPRRLLASVGMPKTIRCGQCVRWKMKVAARTRSLLGLQTRSNWASSKERGAADTSCDSSPPGLFLCSLNRKCQIIDPAVRRFSISQQRRQVRNRADRRPIAYRGLKPVPGQMASHSREIVSTGTRRGLGCERLRRDFLWAIRQ